MSDFYLVNAVLSFLCTFYLCFRLPQALLAVYSKRTFITLALYVPVAGIGSLQGWVLDLPVTFVSYIKLVLNLFLLYLLVFWNRTDDNASRRGGHNTDGGNDGDHPSTA
jgi:hypothetical protein